jgi:hypothetical protein
VGGITTELHSDATWSELTYKEFLPSDWIDVETRTKSKHTVSVINKLSARHYLLKYLLCFVKQRHRTKYIYVWFKEFECYGQFLYSFIFLSFPT